MINILTLFITIAPIFSFEEKILVTNKLIKTAKMLEQKGDLEGAILIYEDIHSKEPEHKQTIKNLKMLY